MSSRGLLITNLFLFLTAMSGLAQAGANNGSRPNLVFIMSDQHSFDMVGWHDGSQALTPHLEKLASMGMVFRNAVVNTPQCTPYRGILLSGMHSIQNGAMNNDIRMLSSSETGQPGSYFAEVLARQGYQTGYIGKWHLYGGDRARPIPAGPHRYGFDGYFLSNNCTLEFEAGKAYWWDSSGHKQFHQEWEPFGQSRHADDFISRQSDSPFALFIAYHPPHDFGGNKYNAPEKYMAMYDEQRLKLRDNVADNTANRIRYRGHLAMISGIDEAVGVVVAALERKGLLDNTIIVFTADHGDMLFSHNWPNNKGRPENESLHVPLLIRWPKAIRPGSTNMLIGTLDLMPTLLGLLNIAPPNTCQGKDLSTQIVRHRKGRQKQIPIYNHQHDWRGVYTKRFTYAFCTDPAKDPEKLPNADTAFSRFVLYDRKKDPAEKTNLFNDPGYARIQRKLDARTRSWMSNAGEVDMPYEKISRLIRSPAHGQQRPWPAGEGLLKGIPSQILKGTGQKEKTDR